MTTFASLFSLKDESITTQLEDNTIVIRLLIHTLVGIFVLGYVSWKSKQKREGKP